MSPHLARRAAPALACLVFLQGAASAHERWVHHDLIRPFDRMLFDRLCWTNALAGLAILGALLALSWLARHDPLSPPAATQRPASQRRFPWPLEWCPTVLRLCYGFTLVAFALRGQYLAPDLRAGGTVEGQLLIGAAAAAGSLLILGYRTRESALVTLAIFAWAVLRRPFEAFDLVSISARDVLCYGEVTGIALYLAIVGPGRLALDSWRRSQTHLPEEAHRVGVALNRIALGATLCLLGLVKFVIPELFMGVVQNNPEVFYAPFEEFLGVSEEEVVFGASVIEVSLGLLLILGIYTRVTVLVLGTVFVTTAILFQEEVLGHLPLVGMVLVLLVEGGGSLRPLWRFLELARRDPRRFARLDPVVEAGTPLRRTPALLVSVAAVGLAFGATLHGSQPSHASGGPWEPELGPETPSGTYVGHRGRCSFTLEVVPERFGVNELFALRTTVRDAETGERLENVVVEVDITLPQHGRGMPTAPQTRAVQEGRWVTEGCKLPMYGAWVVQVMILRNGELWDRTCTTYDFRPVIRP